MLGWPGEVLRGRIPNEGGPPRGTHRPLTRKAKMDTLEKLKVQKMLSALTVVVGFVLMAGKIYADREPGAIPLLLVALGAGWYLLARARARPRRR